MKVAVLQSKRQEIKSLTGIRAYAAWWVVLYHLVNECAVLFPAISEYLNVVVSGGYLGVDLFFILSGFIISYNYAELFQSFSFTEYRKFLWMRLARIYPVHLFTLLFLGLLLGVASFLGFQLTMPELFTTEDFFRNIFLVHAWEIPQSGSWNAPAWSISSEWMAYIFFPFLMLIIRYIRKVSILIISILLTLLGMAAICNILDYPSTSSYAMIRISTEFLAGCLLFQLYQLGWQIKANWGLISFVSILTIWAITALFHYSDIPGFWMVPLFALLIYSLSFDKGKLAEFFSTRSILYWGRVSYSLYMTHGICLFVLRKMLPVSNFAESLLVLRIGIIVVYLSVISVAAIMVYELIEENGRQWMRNAYNNFSLKTFGFIGNRNSISKK